MLDCMVQVAARLTLDSDYQCGLPDLSVGQEDGLNRSEACQICLEIDTFDRLGWQHIVHQDMEHERNVSLGKKPLLRRQILAMNAAE